MCEDCTAVHLLFVEVRLQSSCLYTAYAASNMVTADGDARKLTGQPRPRPGAAPALALARAATARPLPPTPIGTFFICNRCQQ